MRVSEVFYSVQGEINIGKPSVFVRLSGCNLIQTGKGCAWCDTKYAEEGTEMSVSQVFSEAIKYGCTNIIVSGGEPLLQLNELFELIDILWRREPHILELETNGTVFDERVVYWFNQVNCSPKKQALDLEVLKLFAPYPYVKFKFVFERKEDLWWEEVIEKLKVPSSRVWIMPQGITREVQLELGNEVIEYCKLKKYNFSPRFHIIQWGPKRGV